MVGEHIRALKGGRWSHAIDCGDETVLHLADDETRRAVRRSYRPEFIAGAEVVEVVRHRQRTFPGNEIVARAYSRIADPALASMFVSSEAFAHWCATGRPPAPDDEAEAPAPAPRARGAAAPRTAPSAKGGRPRRAAAARRAARPTKKAARGSGSSRAKRKRGAARGGARAGGAAGARRRKGAKRR
jgi:hypothetical protein